MPSSDTQFKKGNKSKGRPRGARNKLTQAYLKLMDDAVGEHGLEALEKVEEASPDLVLLDILLPRLDGMEVLSRIKVDQPEIPVIMITAYSTVERATKAILEQGAYDFITKP